MSSLLYYNPALVYTPENLAAFPQLNEFAHFRKFFNPSIALVDRTGTFDFPFNLTNQFPLPAEKTTTTSFEELCYDRLMELYKTSWAMGMPVTLLYSGGIDSTLILCLMLKYGQPEQLKRTVIALNEKSIQEYPELYNSAIKGKFQLISSSNLQNTLSNDKLICTGEFSDNVFGSLALRSMIGFMGTENIINRSYKNDLPKFFMHKLGDKVVVDRFMEKFEQMASHCPYPIVSNFDMLWWMNFAMKWQPVQYRIVSHKPAALKLTQNYFDNQHFHFFNTEKFQQWSMSNPDKKIGNTWASYKQICKDMIYEVTKDAVYRDLKTKIPSLPGMVRYQNVVNFIDSEYNTYDQLDIAQFMK